jgi:8-hydroxy-5-deazaflavin:NADPH oxidoreductase
VRIGILGTGIVGRTLGVGLRGAGHDVLIGTRDVAHTLARTDRDAMGNPPYAEWQQSNPGFELVPFAEAGAHAELVVNATAGEHSLEAIGAVGDANLAGKVLVDVANPLDFSHGMPPMLSVANTDSLGEQIQRTFPDARVVKTLNTMNAYVMIDPSHLPGRHNVFLAGDDAAAKGTVGDLLGELGWPAEAIVDLGGIRSARGLEMFLPFWLSLLMSMGTGAFNIAVVRAATA